MKAIKTALHRWLVGDRLIGQRLVAALSWIIQDRANRNTGWYGAEEIEALTGGWRQSRWTSIRNGVAALSRQLDFYGDQMFVNQVWKPISGSTGNNPKPLRDPVDPDFRQGDKYLEGRRPHSVSSSLPPSFSIVTPYYKHFAYFRDCARSVAKAMLQFGLHQVEWVVVNDDPSIVCDQLWSAVPRAIRDRTRIIANGTNIGNTATLNAGIAASRFEWIIFLDCDDVVAGRALRILSRYIAAYRQCRYFSSSMVDIDSVGRVLRYRIRDTKATQLFAEGMTAGHLKAVRRDAFDDLGLLDVRFDGCQDYEFALRIAVEEPICFIPEFLCRYRWHTQTQSLSGLDRQLSRAREIRQIYLNRIKASGAGPESSPHSAISVRLNLDDVSTARRS